MRSRAAILAASLLALAACTDNPIESDVNDASTVSFNFSGTKSGNFTVRADPPAGQLPLDMTHAHGRLYSDSVSIEVLAYLQRGGGRSDWLTLNIPGQSPGTFTIDRSTCEGGDDSCAKLGVAFDVPSAGQGDLSCAVETGTLRVTSVSSARAAGVFSGTGTCYSYKEQVSTPFQVTGGRFDVKLRNVRRD